MMHRLQPKHHFNGRQRQSGVVLIVALVMLVVIGLASVSIMRNAISTDIISDNTRRQTQALQGAQAGLRFCELQVTSTDDQVAVAPEAAAASIKDEDWQTFSNWQATGKRRDVTAGFLQDAASKGAPLHVPQCMAQLRTVGGTAGTVVVITARGFSDNYTEDEDHRTKAGAVVWLQSIVQLASASGSTL
ncbi:MAG: hypothetical protein Q7U28_17585 [Aquabacterium sp.]|nr:hypothetical protein [Aquabacterium sp.]